MCDSTSGKETDERVDEEEVEEVPQSHSSNQENETSKDVIIDDFNTWIKGELLNCLK